MEASLRKADQWAKKRKSHSLRNPHSTETTQNPSKGIFIVRVGFAKSKTTDPVPAQKIVKSWPLSAPTVQAKEFTKLMYCYVQDHDSKSSARSLSSYKSVSAAGDFEVSADLAIEFKVAAEKWYDDTIFESSIIQQVLHPSYQRIIGMGKPALPFIFRELKKKQGHWFWALVAISGQDAAKPGSNVTEAEAAWVAWGKKHGYL